MPSINIPPIVRFWLYIAGAILLQVVSYCSDKSWAGGAEVRFATGIASLLQLLAAAKTDLSRNRDDGEAEEQDPPPDPVVDDDQEEQQDDAERPLVARPDLPRRLPPRRRR